MAENITKEEISYPKFLNNKPCKDDLFKGQSHKKIAQNIANLIKKDEAKVIGIDGGWGSGKSNMIHLIESELDNEKYHFFIYDAWGCQTDFQRRSILENLTGFLIDEKHILKKEKWNGRLLQLLSRKRSINSKIVKELSAISKVGAILAILSPVFLFVNNYLSENFKPFYWLIILVGSIISLIIMQTRNMRKYGQTITFSSFFKELFFSYLDYENNSDNIEQSIKYETIYDEEPSSRDFRNWMNDINNDLKNNKLIIVFDNMDRLPNNKVQELWSSIHTFFAEKKYSNIYTIVPFDRDHIKSAFKSEDIVVTKNANTDSKCFGNDFINKTFDTIYRVSPPVMSDWKLYFAERWKDAFNSDVSNKVTQIYDLLSDVITPREIIAFINEFVSIRQISDTSIPDEYIALFIFGKDKISLNPQVEILNPTYLGAMEFMYKDDEELPKYISALYYQLAIDKALDIIYTENLRRALDNNDVEKIKIIQSNPNVFYSVLENAITTISNISNTVIALDKCLSTETISSAQLVWDCVYKREKEQEVNNVLQDYQKILIQHIAEKDEYLNKLIAAFHKLPNINAIDYYNGIQQLSEIEGINPFNYLNKKEVDAEYFIIFIEEAKTDYGKYKIMCDKDKLNEYLSNLNIEQLSKLTAIPYIKKEYDLQAYAERLNELFDSYMNDKDVIKIICDRVKEIERPIRKQLSDDIICNYFNSTKEDDEFYYDLICMRLAKLNNFSGRNQSPFDQVFKLNNDSIVEKVAERIEYYINYDEILLNVDKMNYPLYKEVAKKLTEKPIGKSKMDIVLVLQNYEMIKDNLEIDINVLIERLDSWSKFAESKITVDNINSLPIIFFKDIMTIENNLKIHCVQVAEDYLKSQTKEVWKNSIQTLGFVYELLLIIKPNIQASFDAFKELLLDKAKGSVNLTKDICMKLIQLFETNERSMLNAFSDVRDSFCTEVSITNDFFDFYAEWLFNYAKLEDRKDSLRRIFPTFILDKEENISLILNNQDKMFKIVEKAGEENKDFNDKIKSLLAGKYKDNEELKVFANKIGVILDNDSEQVVD